MAKFYEETSTICMQCKGSCWNPSSQSATQKAVLEKYGLIANKCVNNNNGAVNCPYANR